MADRQDIRFASGDDICAGWLYPSAPGGRRPVIVLAHGIGAIKEMGLNRFAHRFQQAGFNALVFDYRHLGASTGRPRQLVDVPRQLEDWSAALDFAETLESVDRERIAIFGTSFAGGHVITVAAREPRRVKAVVSQCPFTSGWASSQTVSFRTLLWGTVAAIRDLVFSWGDSIVPIALAGKPDDVALMTKPDVWQGYLSLVPRDIAFSNEIAARLLLKLPLLAPGRDAKKVQAPIFFAICAGDSVAPADTSIAYAKEAPRGVVRVFEGMGHFDIYVGEAFEKAMPEYIDFFTKHLA
ncbi:uncharacterized protein PFL1_06145 [Pseudozyma flocculosa PF-1]|uniref:Related to hydrolases of the alpha/beta superfamily n=2 Tax=Pseudozyma flocculosa TaxID=84751 RepID=A0A5C3F952_9BASI|nr:uncharacterized protein PFL1_06145 [Pseudozyma flocculosa PF-1]EPQ26210.1 hypothetical protein PFL1_06145 [Pseudozyma flocculosa PF-1]SPO40165.1 related to hydrolases of the alpha/beta superfamily [Pseudozyma flocculosa]